jgi:hypothetical protein
MATAALISQFIESTNVPNRQETAELIRKEAGLPEPGMKSDPAQDQLQNQQAAQQAAQQQEIQARLAQSQVEKSEGQAQKAMADAQLSIAKAQQIAMHMDKTHLNNQAQLVQQTQAQLQPPPTREDAVNQAIAEAMAGL